MSISEALNNAAQKLLSHRHPDGYWWFTLEANESIGAGFIQLMHFIGRIDPEIQAGLVERMLQEQREDGSWGLYYKAPGDISATVECYFALRLAGTPKDHPALQNAKKFIRKKGGLTEIRVFTRIHLALFGLIDWKHCPHMPVEMIFLPHWFPFGIYSFSSWARASIVPLLVLFAKKPVVPVDFDLEELYLEPLAEREPSFRFHAPSPLSFDFLFIQMDRILKAVEKLPWKPTRTAAIDRAAKWIWEHIQKTEDIYPALAYGLMAFKAMDFSFDSPQIQKSWNALLKFQQNYLGGELPNTVGPSLGTTVRRYDSTMVENRRTSVPAYQRTIHQQCCISPVWDTPWSALALIEAELWKTDDPLLMQTARWLISKETRFPHGDWKFKNPEGKPGGWSFEFENEYFPDVDDTIEVLHVLQRAELPAKEKNAPIQRGIAWILSMQNDDGGWGAFDKNNDLDLVNKIPFADHSACLDPSTPDITGRVIELLAHNGFTLQDRPIQRAIQFLKRSQEEFGGWFGRWGVNYIYGTWAVLTGLAYFPPSLYGPALRRPGRGKGEGSVDKALRWLVSVQHEDGGFGESPQSYVERSFVPWERSVPSQTAWGLMALVAGGMAHSNTAKKAADFLVNNCKDGEWAEPEFTGTGFPGHFYIRYHGYRSYFPILALARYQKATV